MVSDRLGDHAISCGIGGERIARHNHCREALLQTAQQAGLGPIREPEGLLPGSDDRPADLLIPHWSGGKDTALDFTVVNPLQSALVGRVAEEGGVAVEHAHMVKVRKYEQRCAGEGIHFLPVAVDTLGGWHPSAGVYIIQFFWGFADPKFSHILIMQIPLFFTYSIMQTSFWKIYIQL